MDTYQALPFPLQQPYFVNRADAWQARIMEAARNYFTPAELSDLQRIGIRFVPQEADRIKRHLRRKGDYPTRIEVTDDKGYEHPRNLNKNVQLAEEDSNRAGGIAIGKMNTNRGGALNTHLAPDLEDAGEMVPDQRVNVGRVADGSAPTPQYNGPIALPNPKSLLRRTQLFIGTMFVFDLAHALLRHLRQEVLSLTANGSEADDDLLRQLCRNVRGMTFQKLRPVAVGAPPAAGAPAPVAGPEQFLIKDDSGRAVLYERAPVRRYSDFEDLFGPFSSTELENLRTKGWVHRPDGYYTPHRLPEWLGGLLNNFKNSDLYITNPERLDTLRHQGIYPTAFLTNGILADDCCAARLTEHVNAPKITTEFFTWQMRKVVFIPLELDVIDISRFQDLEKYDRLGAHLNAFGTGMYQGMNIDQLFPTLKREYDTLRRDVPRNQLGPFVNVAKQIQLPATANASRRTFANEEVIRLFTAADDVLRILDEWKRSTGRLNDVTFADYLNPGAPDALANPNYHRKVMGNRPEAVAYGKAAFGIEQCGRGRQALAYTADPNVDPAARQVPAFLYDNGQEIPNPQARWFTCPPEVGHLGHLDVGSGDDVAGDQVFAVAPRGVVAAQRRKSRKKTRKPKK